jgi:glycosyltransferase involved in cell wall biosynthesis
MSLPGDHNQPLRVAINAQIPPQMGAGGIQSVLIGLLNALGQLDGAEEYIVIGPWEDYDWLKAYAGPNQRIVRGPKQKFPDRHFKRVPLPIRSSVRKLRWLLKDFLSDKPSWPTVPISDGYYENLGCDLIHFPYQDFTLCGLPAVYNPHDLQHVHFPNFYSASAIAWRDVTYRAGCHFAKSVLVASQWVKEDLVRNYSVDPKKIQVIPWAPPTQAYAEPDEETISKVIEEYKLDLPFAFYPAMTWQHKNHIRLIQALALLRNEHSIRMNIVCTGHKNDFWPQIQRSIQELGLEQQVRFLGMVPPEELRALYRLAAFVIIPTLFEAASGPLFEAWQEGTPVACSAVTSLPEQAGNGALLFDPHSVEAIAHTLVRMSQDQDLREELTVRGARRLQDFCWERTAKTYRAVYRKAAGRALTEEDQHNLGWDWMRQSEKGKVLEFEKEIDPRGSAILGR